MAVVATPTLIDELVKSVSSYPTDSVTLEIVELQIPGTVLNASESAQMRVKITNHGALNMANVVVKMTALNNAKVKGQGALEQFRNEAISSTIDLIAARGGSATSSLFFVQAPGTPQASASLARATLDRWDADFNAILDGDTKALSNPKVVYAAEVVGQ